MSLLLEALKRAALEKQSKQDAGAESQTPKQPPFVPSPVTDTTADEAIDLPSETDNLGQRPPLAPQQPIVEDEGDANPSFNDTLDQEDQIEPIEQVDEAELEDWEDFDAADFLDDGDEEEVGNFDFSEETPAAPLAPLALEETEQSLQEARLQQEELLKQQEETEAREKEALESHLDKQRKITARENRHALDQLIASGKAVARRSRRRAMFLYAMLVMTAIGGILAYYFYLLANSSIAELQQTNQETQVIDIAELIESVELRSVAPPDDANNTVIGNASDPQQTNLADAVGARTSKEGGLTNPIESRPTESNNADVSIVTRTTAPGPEQASLEFARRADPAPSVNAYLQPLITSEERGVQRSNVTDRVIIHHEKSSGDLNTLLKDAYTALQQKDLERAGGLYDKALSISPTQRDALLGAAATATAGGRFNDAASFYQKQLAADPKDNFARAGLLALMNDGRSRAAVQQEVSDMLKTNPRSAHLHFLKGVGFAAGSRWPLAQSAFYEAYNLDNKNPDYAFNLAVALDHLNQTPLARIYYERALSLAGNRPANFDAEAVARRLEGLKSL